MAKEAKPDIEPEEILDDEPKAAPKSKRLYILLGLVALILLQTIVMILLLPTTQKLAKPSYGDDELSFDPGDMRQLADTPPPELIEKPLGDKFKIEELGSSGETELFTVTITLKVAKSDEKKFDDLYGKMPNTIRDIVYSVLRASTMEERKQETLGAIKQKIRIRVNEALGANYVRDVLCTDPSVGVM